MAELVDAHVSGACVRKDVRVRLPLSALINHQRVVKKFMTLFLLVDMAGVSNGVC